MVRRLIRQAHLWLGLAMSLLLFVLALSGSALVYKGAYWRLVYPELRAPAPAPTPRQQAAAVAAAHEAFGAEVRSVKFPEPGVAAYHLYLTDGEAFLAADDHRVIDRWRPTERVMALLFDLHAHLLAGETGERVGGVVGLLGALLAASGLVLWWPTRRRFSLRAALWPRSSARHDVIAWHRDVGVLASPILFVLLLTAGGLVFYTAAGRLLVAVLGGANPAVVEAEAPPQTGLSGVLSADLVARAAAVFPDARIVFYYPAADGAGVHRFRLKRPCELHPNGRTYVTVDGAGDVLLATDACAQGGAARTLHALYPLHSAKALGALYKLVVFMGGVALAILAAGGVIAYARKLGMRRRPRRRAVAEAR